jgi:hypothetical protein
MIMIIIYSMHVSCLHRWSIYLFIHLSLVSLWVRANPLHVVVCWFSCLGALLRVGWFLVLVVLIMSRLWTEPSSRSRDRTTFGSFGHGFTPPWP